MQSGNYNVSPQPVRNDHFNLKNQMTNSRAAKHNSMDTSGMENQQTERTRDRIHKQRTRRRETIGTGDQEEDHGLAPNQSHITPGSRNDNQVSNYMHQRKVSQNMQ